MKIPAILYGSWKDVKPRVSKIVTQMKRGGPFDDAMSRDGFLDTNDVSGLLLINPAFRSIPTLSRAQPDAAGSPSGLN